jgi:hypothetical protein
MIYDDSMNSESSNLGEQPDAPYTPEQLAAIRSLDEPSTTTSRRAISKSAEFAAMATGALVACAICIFFNPALAWAITCIPGGVAIIYVGRRIIFGRPLTNTRSSILYMFLIGMLLAGSLWRLRHLR